jgi:hypothetical protein
MQYLCVGHKSCSNMQYPHSWLSFIDMKGSNLIKMLVSSFSAIPSLFCVSYSGRQLHLVNDR